MYKAYELRPLLCPDIFIMLSGIVQQNFINTTIIKTQDFLQFFQLFYLV